MKKWLFVLMVIGLLMAPGIWAANTITSGDGTVTITDIDEDWDMYDLYTNNPQKVKIISIQFNPGASDDVCFIRNGSDTGPPMFDVTCVDAYDQRIKYWFTPVHRHVYLKFSDGAYSAGSKIIIEFSK